MEAAWLRVVSSLHFFLIPNLGGCSSPTVAPQHVYAQADMDGRNEKRAMSITAIHVRLSVNMAAGLPLGNNHAAKGGD